MRFCLVGTQVPWYTLDMSLSDAIRHAIERSPMNRAAIARKSGVSEGQLSRFVHGERMLTAENLERVADALGLEVVIRPKRRRKG